MKYDLVFAFLVVAAGVVAWVRGARVAAAAAILASTALVPITVLGRSATPHVGEAPAVPALFDYTAFLLLAAVVLAVSPRRRPRGAVKLWLPVLAWLILGRWLWWGGSAETMSGLLQIAQGGLAFCVGAALGPWDEGDDPHPGLLVGIAVLQVIAVALGSVGVLHLHPSGVQSADLAGRAFGTLGHPDQLAKTLAIGLAATLPAATSPTRRRFVVTGALVALGGIALSQGRAAFGGAVAMVLVWALLQPRAGDLRRRTTALLVVVAAVVGLSATTFQERFAQDPGGGARGQLTAVALRAVRERPLGGTGPNAYVSVVGRSDELTSTGVPVHNVLLMAAAELGVPGAILLLFPFAAMWATAWRRRNRSGAVGGHARACLAMLPLAVILGWTGWGLLETSVFMVFCYVSGYLWGNLAADDGERERPASSLVAAR